MKKYLLLLPLVLLFSCKKSRYDIVKDIVSHVVGTYTTTQICSVGNSSIGYTYDTTYNVQLTISRTSDTVVSANGFDVLYCCNQNNQYQFYGGYGHGGGATLIFDDKYKLVYFDNSTLFGSGCNYYPH